MATEQLHVEQVSPAVEYSYSPSKKLAGFAVLGLLALFIASVIFNPAGDPRGEYLTICGFKNITGLPCPACGLTHSFCAIGKGHLGAAFAFNLLGPLLYFALLLLWTRAILVLGNKLGPVLVIDRWCNKVNVVRSIVLAFMAFGFVRIVYLIVFPPPSVVNSPLMKAVGLLFG
jgi:uncharacterized protein DUF2752